MDPISLILAALAAGGAALARGSLGEAGKDIYKGIKARIRQKLEGKIQGQIALIEYEKDPETWEKPLKKTLAQIRVDRDEELLKMARQLLAQANSYRGRQDVHIENSNLINSPIITGDIKVEQRGTHNVYIGKAEQIVLGPQNRPTRIREVKIDLRLSNGEYPKLFWLEEAEVPNLFSDGLPQVTREWWEPSNFNRERLRQILLDEINRLSASGWELVENNLDDLWQVQHNVQETMISKLTNLVGISIGRTWKNSLTIYGAVFHVRRAID